MTDKMTIGSLIDQIRSGGVNKVKKEKINNTQLLADTGLKVRHFHGRDKYGYPRVRAMTVAFRESRSNLEFATAVVHPDDCFCKKVGTKLAVESFLQGKTVRIPKAMTFEHGFSEDKPKLATANRTLGIMFAGA